jgi:GTPase
MVQDEIQEAKYETKQYILLDTAGIRQKGKRQFGAEDFAVQRTIQAAYDSDVICLVVDGSQPISHQDQVVAGIAKEVKKSVIVVANKSDLVDLDGKKKFEREFYTKFAFLKVLKFIWVSAVEKKGLFQIWEAIDDSLDLQKLDIDKMEMRKIFNYLMKHKQPQKMRTQKKAVIYDFIYTGNSPHTFELLLKEKKALQETYVRFLENFVRKQFELGNSGIKIRVVEVQKKRVLS